MVDGRFSAHALDLAEDPKPGARWSAGQLALLGILPDDRVAALTGRDENGVRVKRSKPGIPNPSGPGWTAEELALLGTAKMRRSRRGSAGQRGR
jgi:hypothetical protein